MLIYPKLKLFGKILNIYCKRIKTMVILNHSFGNGTDNDADIDTESKRI